MSAYNYFKDLPPWAKGIVIVGGGLAIYFTGVTVYRNIHKKRDIKDATLAAQAANKELVELKAKGITPTLPESQFQALSESLVQSMNGCGTDEQKIYNVFKQMKNDADIRKLISVFGIRYYEPCAIESPISYFRWQFNDKAFGGGLPSWLGYDLDTDEIEAVNAILRANKVNYTF